MVALSFVMCVLKTHDKSVSVLVLVVVPKRRRAIAVEVRTVRGAVVDAAVSQLAFECGPTRLLKRRQRWRRRASRRDFNFGTLSS